MKGRSGRWRWAAVAAATSPGFPPGHGDRVGPAWGVPDAPIRGLAIDRRGTVWLAAPGGLLRMDAGRRRFEPTAIPVTGNAKLFPGPDDRLWYSDQVYGTRVLSAAGVARPPLPNPADGASQASRLMFDRAGGLWATSHAGGMFRVQPAAVAAANGPLRKEDLTDRFGIADGLSSNIAQPLLEDREGNVWVGTNLGLDRFRASAVVTQTDVPVTSPYGYRAAIDGSGALYVADTNSLRRVEGDGLVEVLASGLPRPRAICSGRDGSLWLANQQQLRRLRGRTVEPIAVPAAVARSTILSCQEDGDGALWITALGEGIFVRHPDGWRHVAIPGEPARVSPDQIFADRAGRMWLNYLGRPLVMIDGSGTHRYGRAEGLDVGDIGIVSPRAAGILVGGDHGIARFDGRRFQSLRATAGNPLNRITGIVETTRGETWFNGISGVVRIATRDLDAAFDRPGGTPNWQMFDFPGRRTRARSAGLLFPRPPSRAWTGGCGSSPTMGWHGSIQRRSCGIHCPRLSSSARCAPMGRTCPLRKG